MNNVMFAEKVQGFIKTLDWEVCPANIRDAAAVAKWETMRMGPTKRKGAASAITTACRLAHVSLPAWAT